MLVGLKVKIFGEKAEKAEKDLLGPVMFCIVLSMDSDQIIRGRIQKAKLAVAKIQNRNITHATVPELFEEDVHVTLPKITADDVFAQEVAKATVNLLKRKIYFLELQLGSGK